MTQPPLPPTYPGYPPYPNPAGFSQPGFSQPPMYPANQPFPAPIVQQPAHGYPGPAPVWTNRNFQGYLQNASAFHVKQKVELLEALVGWETGNKYEVMDQAGNKVFYVGEESNVCGRQLCNARRAFTLTVKDTAGQNVLIMDRSLDCSCCFGCCCPDSLQVSTPSGQLLGSVAEECSILYPTFAIKNASGNEVLRIQGPMCPMSFGACGGSVVFQVLNMGGVSVGTISKEWAGFVQELFTDADHFSISFPADLDPAVKAVCLGAVFLIDFEYFESGATDKHQGGRRLFG